MSQFVDNNVFDARGFAGAAAEKTDAHEGRNAPGPAGSGASKTIIFLCFRQTTYTQNWQACFFENRSAVQITKVASG